MSHDWKYWRVGLLAVAMGLVAFFALGIGASAAPAADPKPSGGGTPTATPHATWTPSPIRLRPRVQFGHAAPGHIERYRLLLFNRLTEETDVHLDARSRGGWPVRVVPSDTVAIPGYANVITVTVGVPMSPTHRIDIEGVRAVTTEGGPYTTTAHLVTIAWRHPYTDLSEQDWADAPVQYLTELGVVGGYPDGTFRPNNTVTRAQFAKMLVAAMQWTLQTPANPSFADVPASHWAYSYVETAAAHGVLAGYTDGTFRPEAGVTRAQVAKMVYVARGWGDVGQADAPAEFVDISPSDWFYSYVRAANVAEIMAGYQDGTFRPNAPATRGQIAKILAVALFSSPSE
ncbi:MAG TPA: S-layer homology domain-containing protein [Chloroflexia bacterium]|nr:S-layer homology domain-containing protein [Chloroflexia bacterium]